jgi:quinol monooxygenase YgiN
MIIASFRITISPPKNTDALKILRLESELCRDNPGCHSCHIYGDLEDSKAHMIEELWWTQEELDMHLRSAEFRNLLLVLELADKKPEIRFDTVSHSAGIEMVERARGIAS